MIKRALISVSDKSGIEELARFLTDRGITILSTGGTAKLLDEKKIPCTEVAKITEFPECLDGRVKTLHPRIHGGILAIRKNQEHMQRIDDLGIDTIDLVIVNLYPFKKTIQKPNAEFQECVENIDIGGPSMLRAAAKNHQDVTVVTDPADYAQIMREIESSGDTSYQTRFYLAGKVFSHSAAYDALIAEYFNSREAGAGFPEQYTLTFDQVGSLRYGENAHQKATFFRNAIPIPGTMSEAIQKNGKELSYNNIADADATISCLKEFSEPTIVAVKHANPCGIGSADDLYLAWRKAYEADTVSIFGGIVAANRQIDEKIAKEMSEIFLEVIIAPSYTPEALQIFGKKKNLRVLELPGVEKPLPKAIQAYKFISGGLLVQDYDADVFLEEDCKIVTKKQPAPELLKDIAFGMKAVKHVKSNGIAVVKDCQTLGIGPGQVNRIGAAHIAFGMAGEKCKGAVMASDAFFPFRDCVDAAHAAGISVIVQPGGSLRDQESIDACDACGIAMVITGMRHFRH